MVMEELLNIDNTAVRTHSRLFFIEGKSWLVNFFCPARSVFTLIFLNRWVNRITDSVDAFSTLPNLGT